MYNTYERQASLTHAGIGDPAFILTCRLDLEREINSNPGKDMKEHSKQEILARGVLIVDDEVARNNL